MSYKVKSKQGRGRPKVDYKVRSIKGITPKGFCSSDYEVKGGKIIFKKKK